MYGGATIYFWVCNKPYRKPSSNLQLQAGYRLFGIADFKNVAMGYFGHMWELYAFWAFIPFALKAYNTLHNGHLSVSIGHLSLSLWVGFHVLLAGICPLNWGVKMWR
jgi:hypothetical protein